jgi:ubiquinone/menaquinone biosynthesis C-methylase UbiE
VTTKTPPAERLQPEQLTFLYEAWATRAVLEASHELGVLDRLGRGPVDAGTLAGECGIGEDAARALLTALAAIGVLQPDGHGAVQMVGGAFEFLDLLRLWDGLAEGLRRRPEPPADVPLGAEDRFPDTVQPLAAMCASASASFAEHVISSGDTSELAHGARRVLDLGAGAAPWSLALAAADGRCVVTALDLPAVLPTTRQVVAGAGRGEQYRFVDGDLFTVDLDDGAFDLVIVGNVCHLFDDACNRTLLARVARWLAPGGIVAVIDFLCQEGRNGPRSMALYGVELVRRTVGGQVYPFSSYAGWLREAGCERVERIELSSYPPVTLIRARRS